VVKISPARHAGEEQRTDRAILLFPLQATKFRLLFPLHATNVLVHQGTEQNESVGWSGHADALKEGMGLRGKGAFPGMYAFSLIVHRAVEMLQWRKVHIVGDVSASWSH
jgi:hypothetical protein